MADDRSKVIKKASKGSTVVVWDRSNYVLEAEKQAGDDKNTKDGTFNKKILKYLVGTSNRLFQNLKSKGKLVISSLNILPMNLKMLLFWVSYTCYPRFMRGYQRFPGDL